MKGFVLRTAQTSVEPESYNLFWISDDIRINYYFLQKT
jgi:hypothetical protein